jgi:hypothetical protein
MRAIDRHEAAICAVYDACEDGESYSLVVNRVAREHGLQPERLQHLISVWCAVGNLHPTWRRGHDITVDGCPMAWSPSVDPADAESMAAIYRDINPGARVRVIWRWITFSSREVTV